ncbi:MAG: nickel pincer cofactor biosynthesis protein LarB [Solirubrobacterales bacterium]
MQVEWLQNLLEQVARGETQVADAVDQLKHLPYQDLGFARIDTHRGLRDHFPEVIYCPGKRIEDIAAIVTRMDEQKSNILATRADETIYRAVLERVPRAIYHDRARVITVINQERPKLGKVAVVTAGTADIPVAEEALVCLQTMGGDAYSVYDVGVAGIHRLFDRLPLIREAQVVIVVAGMEGALASVVGGLTSKPVIAVPTSVGYGANFGGLSALLSMLNSCAAGVGVVNIDNGYGAAALAMAILNAAGSTPKREG